VPGVPTIETPRLLLREWRDSDLEAWVRLNADPRVTRFFHKSYTHAECEASAAAIRERLARDGFGWWVVEIRAGVSFAGVVALQAVPLDLAFTPANEIGWRFAFEHWGHGYATEGAAAALDYAFDKLRWPEVVAFTAASNLRSRRVMERLGMTHDPRDDFDHPKIELDHPLRRHVLYRICKPVKAPRS
jgi:3-dehydroquinate dehydratase / shikimate dehydrogenase